MEDSLGLSSSGSSTLPNWTPPQSPITVVKNGRYYEWEWQGIKFRPYFKDKIWICSSGDIVCYGFHDREAGTIKNVGQISVQTDEKGKAFIDNNGTTTYLEDALQCCYPKVKLTTKPRPPKALASTWTKTDSVQAPVIPPQPKKPNVNIFYYEDHEYGFNFDLKFCVSKTDGLAAWMMIDWQTKTYSKVIPYKTLKSPDGRRVVKVKQPDKSYREFDVATAVCTTFNGKPSDSTMVVKFKDGDITNCDADNLYWDKP